MAGILENMYMSPNRDEWNQELWKVIVLWFCIYLIVNKSLLFMYISKHCERIYIILGNSGHNKDASVTLTGLAQ